MALVMEDVTESLGTGTVKDTVLTWVASFAVFHQRYPKRASQLCAVLYRYGLGVEGEQKLNMKATKAMQGLLG